MGRKNPKEYTSISVRKKEVKKLSKHKVHPSQPMWDVIKKLLDEKERK